MAGDWLKVEKITPDKPEIEAMAALLNIDPDAVFGKCFRLWRWFDDHTTDGNAPSVTKALVDRRVGVTGFADAMESVGWLIVDDNGLHLPRFDRHNGQTGKQRSLTAKRVAEHKAKGNAKGNAPTVSDALPREEKRREETSSPKAPPPATKGGGSNRSQAWKGVEEDLLVCGVAAASVAVGAAIANGCRPDDVTNVIGFWRLNRPKWHAGALYTRVTILRPAQDCSELWPTPSAEFEAEQRREKSAKSQSNLQAERESAAKAKAEEDAKFAALEAEFGQKIDAMSGDEIRDLIRREFDSTADVLLKQVRGGRPSQLLRRSLLEHFSFAPKEPRLILEAPCP